MKKQIKSNKSTSKGLAKQPIKAQEAPKTITFKIPTLNFSNFKTGAHGKTLLLMLIVGLLFGYLLTSLNYIPNFKNISLMEARKRADTYLTSLQLDSYEIKEIKSEGSLYTIELIVNGQPYTSYMAKDGKLFFGAGVDLTKTDTNTPAGQKATTDLPKTDKPNVELFVMSHCPYGTQVEKGILPVLNTLGNKIDFEVKFVDYAMHGEKEVLEQLNQYCIQKMGKDVYLSYLKCFLDKGDSASCLTANKIDQNQLKACTTETDKKFGIMAGYNDKSQWKGSFPPFNTSKEDNLKYSVQGSPTLVINGKEAQSGRDSASLLKTICSSFNVAPEECNVELDSAQPTPGFGYNTTTTDASSAAQCL